MKNKAMSILLASALMFTGVIAGTETAFAGASPYCIGYADDVCQTDNLNWYLARNTYYSSDGFITVCPITDYIFRLVHENGFYCEFSRYNYMKINSDGSIVYAIGKILYTYHPYGDYLTYHYRGEDINYYR